MIIYRGEGLADGGEKYIRHFAYFYCAKYLKFGFLNFS